MPVLRISDESSDYLRELAERAGSSMSIVANSLLGECKRQKWTVAKRQTETWPVYVLTSGDDTP